MYPLCDRTDRTSSAARFYPWIWTSLSKCSRMQSRPSMLVAPAASPATGVSTRPVLAPYPENKAMELVDDELGESVACCLRASYPLSRGCASEGAISGWGDPPEWVVEVKMGRFRGDNGKPDDTGIKDLVSPFRDRSALIDGVKLAESQFSSPKAVFGIGLRL
jgi:hypothetical protein